MRKKLLLLHIPLFLFILVAIIFKKYKISPWYDALLILVMLVYGFYFSRKIRYIYHNKKN